MFTKTNDKNTVIFLFLKLFLILESETDGLVRIYLIFSKVKRDYKV